MELKDVKGDITFENVSFQYEENTEKVLNHISLNVPAGAYMALVGSSGAGKSTLCSLIPRFYDVTGGAVKIDGKDVRDLTLKSLRDHIGIVQQDVYLFVGTVFDNIRYGKPDATREEVIEAAKNANAHEFIMSLPNGYETDIGQRGIKLSGGQKQRLSIARVFLKNPPILILMRQPPHLTMRVKSSTGFIGEACKKPYHVCNCTQAFHHQKRREDHCFI